MGAVADYIHDKILGHTPNTSDYASAVSNLYSKSPISKSEGERQLFGDPLNHPDALDYSDSEYEEIEPKEKKGKTRGNLNEEMMKLIPIGVCIRCQTLMYLGMTNCSKCGAPVGESIDLEELQDKVQELLKPESEIVYKEVPQHQFWGYGTTAITNSPITMACYTSDENMVGITYNFESS